MNYFQNLYLCDSQQPKRKRLFLNVCCELLSKFVSLWLPTTFGDINTISPLLWITFKICIFVTPNNSKKELEEWLTVVNYFQNLYLCDFEQQQTKVLRIVASCELLSKFVPLWFSIKIDTEVSQNYALWVIFKICIFVIANNERHVLLRSILVVNYFQNLYLCDFQQRYLCYKGRKWCCELLSKFVPLWLQTTNENGRIVKAKLWITFKICIFVIWNNLTSFANFFSLVMDYLQNLYFWDSQQLW